MTEYQKKTCHIPVLPSSLETPKTMLTMRKRSNATPRHASILVRAIVGSGV